MRNYQKHVDAEGGSYRLAIRNIVCHLDMMTDEQKAAINWHAEQSVSLAVMRVIAMDEYRAVANPLDGPEALALAMSSVQSTSSASSPSLTLQELRDQLEQLKEYVQHTPDCLIDAWINCYGGAIDRPQPDCTCGLEAVLSPLIEQEQTDQR